MHRAWPVFPPHLPRLCSTHRILPTPRFGGYGFLVTAAIVASLRLDFSSLSAKSNQQPRDAEACCSPPSARETAPEDSAQGKTGCCAPPAVLTQARASLGGVHFG